MASTFFKKYFICFNNMLVPFCCIMYMHEIVVSLDPMATKDQNFVAKIIIDPQNPTFHECREDNNESEVEKPGCVQ